MLKFLAVLLFFLTLNSSGIQIVQVNVINGEVLDAVVLGDSTDKDGSMKLQIDSSKIFLVSFDR